MDADPTLSDLTPDDRLWRMDWLVEGAYPAHVRRYAQPRLKVALSTLLCAPGDDNALLRLDSTDHRHVHEAWVPIASLPLLTIGDLWRQGCRLASPDYR